MNQFLICLLAVSLCAAASVAQGAHDAKDLNSVTARADDPERLELSTAIIHRRSCSPNTLGLDLKLSFRNTGAEPVIISKKVLLGGIMVSRSPEDAAARKYVTSLRYSLFADEDVSRSALETPTYPSDFVLLRQGEVYETGENVSFTTYVPAMMAGAKSFPEIDFRKGTYFLQIGVDTWPYVADPDPLREKLKEKGFLWTQDLNSAPMPFTADNAGPDAKCTLVK
jgi:hypothetical protein